MYIEDFIRYMRPTGMFRKTRREESHYDIQEWYKFRLYHPLTWIFFLVVYLYYVVYCIRVICAEFKEEIRIVADKKK